MIIFVKITHSRYTVIKLNRLNVRTSPWSFVVLGLLGPNLASINRFKHKLINKTINPLLHCYKIVKRYCKSERTIELAH